MKSSDLSVSFRHRRTGVYSRCAIEEDFGTLRLIQDSADRRTLIVQDKERGPVLRIQYPKDCVGPARGGAEWWVVLPSVQNELYCSYWLRFREGFDFVRGGKLPGLAGGTAPTGGEVATGTNGFSARLMWRPGGTVVQYVYHPDQAGPWGDDFPYDLGGQRCFVPGRWHHVEHRVRLNTLGARDGLVQGWFDGELALDRRALRFRDESSFAIDQLLFSTFFGGNDRSWAPTRNEFVDFDEFVVKASVRRDAGGTAL